MIAKRILVAKTDKQVFTSPESPEQQARWLDLADTAPRNPKPRVPEVNPGSRAREEHHVVRQKVRDLLKKQAA